MTKLLYSFFLAGPGWPPGQGLITFRRDFGQEWPKYRRICVQKSVFSHTKNTVGTVVAFVRYETTPKLQLPTKSYNFLHLHVHMYAERSRRNVNRSTQNKANNLTTEILLNIKHLKKKTDAQRLLPREQINRLQHTLLLQVFQQMVELIEAAFFPRAKTHVTRRRDPSICLTTLKEKKRTEKEGKSRGTKLTLTSDLWLIRSQTQKQNKWQQISWPKRKAQSGELRGEGVERATL